MSLQYMCVLDFGDETLKRFIKRFVLSLVRVYAYKSSTQTIEKCVEKAHQTFRSAIENLRLVGIKCRRDATFNTPTW